MSGRVVVGIGARAGVPQAQLDEAVDTALADAGVDATQVAALATIDRRAREPDVQAVTARRGWLLLAYEPDELAAQTGADPSAVVAARVSTPSVAEAAALAGAGAPGHAELILPKRVFPCVTVAIARGLPAETSPA